MEGAHTIIPPALCRLAQHDRDQDQRRTAAGPSRPVSSKLPEGAQRETLGEWDVRGEIEA